MRVRSVILLCTLLTGLHPAWVCAQSPADEFSIEQLAFFEKRVRPLLVKHCYECHSKDAKPLQANLRLDSRSHLRRGGDLGAAVDASAPQESLLLQAVRYEDGLEMPPAGKLSTKEIEILETWVRQGAPMPGGNEATARDGNINWNTARDYWAFRPLEVERPKSADDWSNNPIDQMLLRKMLERGLQPSPRAAKRVLIRRLYFDLLGLPPTSDEVAAFESDLAPDAWPRLVDRVLARPQFGERWGRYWLDNARYTDVTSKWLTIEGSPFVYRDWVVRALNEDMPYNDFVRLQLSADAIEAKRPEDIAALGFLGLSPTYWKELRLDPVVIEGIVADEWEERVDAFGRTFLGLTIACARCHDHKFDPITTEDYYALAGVFANTRLADASLLPETIAAPARAARQEAKRIQTELSKVTTKKVLGWEERANKLKEQLAAARRTPHFHDPLASTVRDGLLIVEADGEDKTRLSYSETMQDVAIQIRGNPATKGAPATRRFLTALEADATPFRRGSGRIDLADAVFQHAAPLAARVAANRTWANHFGRGLVDTPSNFGVNGSQPTHPELLDYLATRLVEHGWTLKQLHREMLCTAAYQQDSLRRGKGEQLDPDNRLLWRMPRRRLDIESWRDAALQASGELDLRIGGAPIVLSDVNNRRRTIYGQINRPDVDLMLQLHDFPDPTAHSPQRRPTITPLQQLFVLNSPFVEARSAAFADRLMKLECETTDDRLRAAFQLAYQREPEAWELKTATQFLIARSSSPTQSQAAWRQLAQVLLGANEFLFID